ncbi:hypothetical protein HMPREF0027_0198 [Actinobacillus ureae ATCC 25976]|uniref:Uncharacterized protein n=1 Tax=Actinobacillus ureae ATCC 25976 TaxID=887324 RepID=E8KED1_9PAST|nr:hypothetical protein HMPREF0027_0198 [Actinobacillus ureae ATCC 25976]
MRHFLLNCRAIFMTRKSVPLLHFKALIGKANIAGLSSLFI